MSAVGFGIGGLMTGLANGMRTGITMRNWQDEEKLRQQQYEKNQIELNALKRRAVEASDLANIRQSGVQQFNDLLQNGGVQKSDFSDYYRKNIVPKLYDTMVSNNDLTGAEALKKWSMTEEAQHIAETRGLMALQVHHAAQTGDFAPISNSFKSEWNSLPANLTGGSTFKRIDVQKGPGGAINGITAVFAGPDGRQFKRHWGSVAGFVDTAGRWLDPTLQFHYEQQRAATQPLVTAELGGNGTATPAVPTSPAPNPDIANTVFNPAPESEQATPAAVATVPAASTASAATPSTEQPLASVPPAATRTGDASGSVSPVPTTQTPAEAPAIAVPTTAVTHAVPEPVPTGAGSINGSTAPEEAAAFSPAPTEAPPAQGNVETVNTQPANRSAPETAPATQPNTLGLPQNVHDAIVRAYESGDKNNIALADKVLAKYAPKYTIEKTSNGGLLAVNPQNPEDSHWVYGGSGTWKFMRVSTDQNQNPIYGWVNPTTRQVLPRIPASDMPGASSLTGDAYLKTLEPQQAEVIRAIIQGRYPLPSSFALERPYWQRTMQEVAQADPKFDATLYPARNRMFTDATSGKMAATNNALNTGIGHLAQLANAVAGLKNGDVRALNLFRNWWRTQTGNPLPTNFKAVAQRVAPEIERIWRGAGGDEADIERDLKIWSSGASSKQLYGSIYEVAHLMQSKINANQSQYDLLPQMYPIKMITPGSQATLTRLEKLGAVDATPNSKPGSRSTSGKRTTKTGVTWSP